MGNMAFLLERLAGLAMLLIAGLTAFTAVAGEKRPEKPEAIIARALDLSDIRSPQSSGFRLRARFRLTGLAAGPLDGAYLLTWASASQWREEITAGDYGQVSAGGADKFRRQTGLGYRAWWAEPLSRAIKLKSHLKVDAGMKLKETGGHVYKGVTTRCVQFSGKDAHRSVCFDSAIGTIVRVSDGDGVFDYLDYAAWNNKRFPRTIHASQGDYLDIEMHVDELVEQPGFDAALLVQPAGAQELCENPDPPKLMKRQEPKYPEILSASGVTGRVFVYGVVGTDGGIGHLRIVQSSAQGFNAPTTDAVSQWRFRPGNCNGVPVPADARIEINFQLR